MNAYPRYTTPPIPRFITVLDHGILSLLLLYPALRQSAFEYSLLIARILSFPSIKESPPVSFTTQFCKIPAHKFSNNNNYHTNRITMLCNRLLLLLGGGGAMPCLLQPHGDVHRPVYYCAFPHSQSKTTQIHNNPVDYHRPLLLCKHSLTLLTI